MSEQEAEQISPQDFRDLQAAVADLARAQQELAEARTSEEREDAREEVAESKADLDALAKELGISPSKLRAAAAKAKDEEESERLRPLVKSLVAELLDEEVEAPTEEDKPDEDDDAEKPKDEPAPEPEPDSAPVQSHWSERPVGELLR